MHCWGWKHLSTERILIFTKSSSVELDPTKWLNIFLWENVGKWQKKFHSFNIFRIVQLWNQTSKIQILWATTGTFSSKFQARWHSRLRKMDRWVDRLHWRGTRLDLKFLELMILNFETNSLFRSESRDDNKFSFSSFFWKSNWNVKSRSKSTAHC